jgi:hypothetical protein
MAANTPYQWIQVCAQAPFAPRDGAGALVFNERMWLIGGWNPNDKTHFPRTCSNDVWSSANGVEWIEEKNNTFATQDFDPEQDWAGRHTAGYAVLNQRMWIVGGDANQGSYQNDVWNSADGKTWNKVNSNVAWGPRALHYTVAFDGALWVMGGQTIPQIAPAPERVHRDVWKSADGIDWQLLHPVEPQWAARGMIGGSAVFQDRIWFIGGGTYDTIEHPERSYYNSVWSTADGIKWQCHAAVPPWTARQYHEVAVFDDKLWVLEGYNGANRNDVWYSPDGGNWTEVPQTPWAPRHAASVLVFDDALWVIAGNNMESDVWKLVRR